MKNLGKKDRKSRTKWLEKGIIRLTRAISKERIEDDNRDPHQIPTPFSLEARHTHQDSEEANRVPAIFLTCATQTKEGGEEELMGIKLDKNGEKGDQKVVIICNCSNPEEIDSQRTAVAQQIEPGKTPIIPKGSYLVSSRAVFLPSSTLFLLQITHPAINQSTPEDLIRSASQALSNIKESLKLEDLSQTAETDNSFFQDYMAKPPVPSAPPYEDLLKQEQEQGAAGGDLPYDGGEKIPGAHKDQEEWINPEVPAQQGQDKMEHMIIIHKKDSSSNKQTLKFLAKEHLTKLGWSNLKFPDRSQENAQGAAPEDIFGYLLYAYQEDNKGARRKENKPSTSVAFIMKDHQNIWMNKAVKTYNLSSELGMTLLMSDANETINLKDMKFNFGRWDGGVMEFLHAIIEREEKETIKQEQQQDDTIEDIRRKEKLERDKESLIRVEKDKETHRQKVAERETWADMTNITKQLAEQKAELERTKDELSGLYKEVVIVSDVLQESRLQSKRASKVPSSLSSRAHSPTNSTSETLHRARQRLKQTLREKKLKKRQQDRIHQIADLEFPKKESMSTDTSADEEANRTESEDEIPLHYGVDREEQRKMEKERLYTIQMMIKNSQKPKDTYVCPDGECRYTSSREDKIPKHVLNNHSKQDKLVDQALMYQHKIKMALKNAEDSHNANKIKQEEKTKEERIQKQMAAMEKAIKEIRDNTKEKEETQQSKKGKQIKKEKSEDSKPNPDSNIPGTTKNPYYKNSGGAYGYGGQDAGDYDGGGGDDSSHNSDEDDDDDNQDGDGENRDESDDEDYGGSNRNETTEEAVDEEGVDAKGKKSKRIIVKLHFKQANYITPKCLSDSKKISRAMKFFAEKEALTRNDIPNVNGAHGNTNKKPQYSLLVAPWFEKKYKEILKDIGLPNAPDEEFIAWFNAWREARKDGEWLDDDSRLQISNGYNQLLESKWHQLKNLVDGAPALKGRQSAKKLSPNDVKKWMQKGRVYCLKRAIYWKTFSKYMITEKTLHPDIKEAIDTRISTKTFSNQGAWTITTYIEKIILDMLEPEESFGEMEDRLVEKHVRALQKDESTTMLRADLEDDALQLTYVDPSYIRAKKQGKGVINEALRKDKMEGNKQRLLVNIVKTADLYTDLNELYSYRNPSTEVEREDVRDVITDLALLMKTKRARKLHEAENKVYSTGPKKSSTLAEKALMLKMAQIEQQNHKLMLALKLRGQSGEDKGTPKPSKTTRDVGVDIPYSTFKHPCHKCENKPGTLQDKKDSCTGDHHCRNHNGEFMCTKSQACRLRTEKVKKLMAFKQTSIPANATKSTVKQILAYTEEDLTRISGDQPCMTGKECPQKTGGTHSKLCRIQMAEIESQLGVGYIDLTMTDQELVEEQERWQAEMASGGKESQSGQGLDLGLDLQWWNN